MNGIEKRRIMYCIPIHSLKWKYSFISHNYEGTTFPKIAHLNDSFDIFELFRLRKKRLFDVPILDGWQILAQKEKFRK